ncbi:histidine phosphatase superfamily [Nemania abortiva]|nr:histidine phosphatase superfamily [Nemania abortiva]
MTKMTSPSVETATTCPKGLNLEQVHILMRHGERTPVAARFQNAGLSPYWPYCSTSQRFTQIMTTQDGWESIAWKRRLEMIDPKDRFISTQGAGSDTSRICLLGELTDKGRETTLAFGKQLRQLYVDQLGLLPKNLSDPGIVYARTTMVPRVLESVQQALYGLYPPGTYKASTPWEITMRTPADETLLPNTKSCARLAELAREFSRQAAAKWNESGDMRFLSEKLGKWIPAGKSLAVDSRPRLFGVMDTINASIAHGPDTRLPDEFYEERVRKTIDRIVVDAHFHGYNVSREFRTLGSGEFMGGIVLRMLGQVRWNQRSSLSAPPKLSLLGSHDYAFGATLASLGCFDSLEKWPPFTSNIIFELFRKSQTTGESHTLGLALRTPSTRPLSSNGQEPGEARGVSQRSTHMSTTKDTDKLNEYFVRVKYNGRILAIPGCRTEGNHLDGDESVCTLSAFKSIVDKFTPGNWHQACQSNLGAPPTIESDEPAGY